MSDFWKDSLDYGNVSVTNHLITPITKQNAHWFTNKMVIISYLHLTGINNVIRLNHIARMKNGNWQVIFTIFGLWFRMGTPVYKNHRFNPTNMWNSTFRPTAEKNTETTVLW